MLAFTPIRSPEPRGKAALATGANRLIAKFANGKVMARWIWMRIRSLMMELARLLKSSLPVITNWVSASSMDLKAPVTARSACLAALVASSI